MDKYELKRDTLNWLIETTKRGQIELVTTILRKTGAIGGCIGTITGMHGHYDLESIYLEENDEVCKVMCHLDYPAFEADADFSYLTLNERQQIIDLLIEELHRL